MPEVSIVIPCRNEARRLPATLTALSACLDGLGREAEVVVVVEKGSDGTDAIARRHASGDARFRAVCNDVARGKGYAVKTGMLAAEGEIVFFMDADLSVPLRSVGEFLDVFDAGADVVFGSRQHPESVIVHSQPWRRVLAGRVFNFALRVLGATRFKDTQCGFKAFRRHAAREVFSRLEGTGFGFDVEALAWAEVLGFRVVERPVEWSDAPGSKVRALRDGTAAFFEALRGARRARAAKRRS